MAIKDYITSLSKPRRSRFYKFVEKKAILPYYTVYYKFFRNGGHASTADKLLFKKLIEEFELEDRDNE